MGQEGTDIKKLVTEVLQHLKLELSYGKLTAVEKSSIIMSSIALVALLAGIGGFAFYYITSTIVVAIAELTGIIWVAYLIMSVILLLLMVVVYAMRKSWIIDPITRFMSKLFLDPDDNE